MFKKVLTGGDVILGNPWTLNAVDVDAIIQKMLYLSPVFYL